MTLESKAKSMSRKAKCDWDSLPDWMQKLARKSFRKDAPIELRIYMEHALKAYGQEWRRLMKDKPEPNMNLTEREISVRRGVLAGAQKRFPDVETTNQAMEKIAQVQLEGMPKRKLTKTSLKDSRYMARSAAKAIYMQQFD